MLGAKLDARAFMERVGQELLRVDVQQIQTCYDSLRALGSMATPHHFGNPEGIVVYLTATGVRYKLTDAPVQGKGPRDEHGNA